MNYTWAVLVGVLAAVLVDQAVLRTHLLRHKAFWVSYAIMLGFQLLINGLLTGIPIVRYDPDVVAGFRIAYAPFEDLLFGFALVLITLSIWVHLGARVSRLEDRPAPPPPGGPHPQISGRRTRRNRRARSR
jgi:lycopene cyclase domain-containing protein